MAKPNYVILPDGGIAFVNGNGGGGSSYTTVVVEASAGTATELNPHPGEHIKVTGEADSITMNGITVNDREWVLEWTFAADATATVTISPSSSVTLRKAAMPTFESGKSYVLSCQFGIIVCSEVSAL